MNTKNGIVQVGETVNWKGSFGDAEPQLAKIEGIEINTRGGKDGDPVQYAHWSKMTRDNAIISLNNGHWCYGNQISPTT